MTPEAHSSPESKPSAESEKTAALEEHIVEHEVEEIVEHSRLRVPLIYEVIRHEGETELARPATSLWWSGLAAGLSISFSLIVKALLQLHLPETAWRPLVTGFGYSFGFLLVVLARQQLFTENTITAVLPVVAGFTWTNLWRLIRLWSIVLAANLTGTLFAALFCIGTPALPPGLLDTMIDISREIVRPSIIDAFFMGIPAGFLIAAMVWLMPSAETSRFHVVTAVTYVIAIGGFSHIVAGSFEAFLLLANGEIGLGAMLAGFTLPVLFGNVFGGTALFALIAYAQVMKEV